MATEAIRGLIAWLRRQPVQTVIAHIHPTHQASAAVATAAVLKLTDQCHDGETQWRLKVE
ncbi:hypothetical protein ACLMAL_35950 [Nocardia sp. CWNU-33]|uniref:hypothetical protein n=1 Tax=Nocardia sp. CWNU-33 TaxID=3392117 RepID=UPI00398EA242